MSTVLANSLPGHRELPCTDGKPLENSIEQVQNSLLTEVLEPILNALHPDGQYFVGQDVGIYYDSTQPNLGSCRAPDWFYVPDVSPLEPTDHGYRRSYVMWKEDYIPPYLIIEQVSGDGKDERDRKSGGKMWVYETQLKTPYYAIFDGFEKEAGEGILEVYRLVNGKYVQQSPDPHGRYLIPNLNVLLGMEDQLYRGHVHPWLRFYDRDGNLLLTGNERAEIDRRRAERADKKAKEAEQRAQLAEQEKLAADAEIAQLKEQLRKLRGE